MAPSTPQHINILLVDAHKLVRSGLRLLLESYPTLTILGEAANVAEAKVLSSSMQPDLILIDLDDENGLDLIPELLANSPTTQILAMTGLRNLQSMIKAIQLGARGAILKDQEPETLLHAIEKVYNGEIWFDGTLMAQILSKLYRPGENNPLQDKTGLKSLTNRERQIISLVCQGLKNQEIASQLLISEGTVRNYLTNIYEKLGVKDRFGLITFANHFGLDTCFF